MKTMEGGWILGRGIHIQCVSCADQKWIRTLIPLAICFWPTSMTLVPRWLFRGVKWKLIYKTYPYLFTYKNIAKAHPQQYVRTVVEFHLLPFCSSPGMYTTKRKFILQHTAKKLCCHCTCLQIHYLTCLFSSFSQLHVRSVDWMEWLFIHVRRRRATSPEGLLTTQIPEGDVMWEW